MRRATLTVIEVLLGDQRASQRLRAARMATSCLYSLIGDKGPTTPTPLIERLRQARPRKYIYKPRLGLNNISFLPNDCYGHSLSPGVRVAEINRGRGTADQGGNHDSAL